MMSKQNILHVHSWNLRVDITYTLTHLEMRTVRPVPPFRVMCGDKKLKPKQPIKWNILKKATHIHQK